MEEKKPGLITRLLWWVEDRTDDFYYSFTEKQRRNFVMRCLYISIFGHVVTIIRGVLELYR